MYSILVADDFALDRREIAGMVRSFTDLPLVVVGECENGYAALEAVNNLQPDILLCDVEMPGMSGIELATLLRNGGSDVRIVFCSLYDKVHYLRSAIQLSSDGYLMKPFRAEELHDCLKQVLSRMLNLSQQQADSEELRQAMRENRAALLREFFSDLLLGGETSSINIEHRMRSLGVAADTAFRVCLVALNPGSAYAGQTDADGEALASYRAFLALKAHSRDARPCFAVHISERLYALVFPFDGAPDARETRAFVAEALEAFVEQMREAGVSVTCAFSRQFVGVKELRAEAQLCRYRLDHRWQYSGDSVIFADDAADPVEPSLPDLGALQTSVRMLLEMENEDIARAAREFAQSTLSGLSAPRQRLVLCYVQGNVRLALEEHGIAPEADARPAAEPETDCARAIAARLENAYQLLHTDASARYGDLSDAVRRYIREGDLKSVQLHNVAKRFAYSPNYLNHVFKTATGETILDYITRCRINRAKELMQETRMSLEEIAEEIGYSHATYLSIVFKKQEGVTPKQFMLRVRA